MYHIRFIDLNHIIVSRANIKSYNVGCIERYNILNLCRLVAFRTIVIKKKKKREIWY